MRKIIAIALAIVMMMAMATTAFADGTVGQNGGKQDIDVNAKYNGSSSAADVISVSVSWGKMNFTYSVHNEKKWDAVNHKYDDNFTKSWTSEGNTVTVTNHSNVKITASLSFAADSKYSGVKGSFDNATLNLPTAEGRSTTDPSLTGTAKLTLSGELASDVGTFTNVGKITVNINKTA